MMNKKAFTLIELLVVVLIIGILAAVALPQYRVAVLKSRVTEVLINMRGLETAQEEYHLINNKWAKSSDDLQALTIPIESNISCGDDFCQNYLLFDEYGIMIEFVWGNYADDRHRCCAVATNSVAVQVCKSFGGRFLLTSDNMTKYTLP